MKGQWMIWLLVTGLAYVSGNICDTDATAECYKKLVHYEKKAFPFYGEGEADLEKTCKNINGSFTCLQEYFKKCNGKQECDENCQSLIKEAQRFSFDTGLKDFADELCEESSPIRKSYLDSYECLEKNADAYSTCHTQSEISLEYILSIKDETRIPKQCCYFSWYHDCLNNIAHEQCGKDAAEYVKLGLNKLIGSLAEKFCGDSDIKCSSPPVHSDDDGHENPTKEKEDEDEQAKKVKNTNDSKKDQQTEKVKNTNDSKKDEQTEKVKNTNDSKKDEQTEKAKHTDDSKKDENKKSSASIISCPVAGTIVVFYFILFMNLLLY